jgi:hypothetical protein
MQASPFSYNELNTSNTKIIQNKKAQIPSQQTLHSHNNSITSEGVFQGHNTPYILFKRKLLKKLPIT